MAKRVRGIREDLAQTMAKFDARLVDARAAAELVEEFGAIERMAAAGRALAAARVAETKVWAESGDRSAAQWLAKTSGTSVGQAVAAIATARNLEGLDATAEAFRTGELSIEQASEIARAATANPHAEADLLATAATAGVAGLREECRRVEASVRIDEVAHDAAIRTGRYARQWVDPEGAWRMSMRDTVDAGARIWAAVEAEQGRLVAAAEARRRTEPREAFAADAVVALATRSSFGGKAASAGEPRASVHVRIDHSALVCGHTEAGEVCEIPGIGPIPVARAPDTPADSVLSVIVTKGVEIIGVAHAGRTIRANVRRAVEERSPNCDVPDCPIRHGLEIDQRHRVRHHQRHQARRPRSILRMAPLPQDPPRLPSHRPTPRTPMAPARISRTHRARPTRRSVRCLGDSARSSSHARHAAGIELSL